MPLLRPARRPWYGWPMLLLVLLSVLAALPAQAAPGAQSSVSLYKTASVSSVPINGDVRYGISVFSDVEPRSITVVDSVDAQLQVLSATATNGTCAVSGQQVTCTVSAAPHAPAQITLTARVRPSAAPGSTIANVATAEGGAVRSTTAAIQVSTASVTPRPLTPTPRPSTPAPTVLPGTPPAGLPAQLTVALDMPTQLWLDQSTQPDQLSLELAVESGLAMTLAVTVTLQPPLIGWNGAVFPQATRVAVDAASARYPLPGISGVTVPATTPIGTRACATVLWSSPVTAGVQTAEACTTVVFTANPSGSPVPTTAPTPGPAAPACLLAAMYALSKQGAIYSQGGYLPNDPIDPATGQPYPRTGPGSFDCSGLVWAAYDAAGIRVGWTTQQQVSDGWAIPCTLADLEVRPARCWAPGDLIFGPGHVAMYVGSPDAPLFMDCYNHAVGCILHDITQDSYYQTYRAQLEARRIVTGCELLALDPGAPFPPPIPGAIARDDRVCVPNPPNWTESGVGYSRGCGPPVLPSRDATTLDGTALRQFIGIVGWLGDSGRMHPPWPAGAHLHLGLNVGTWVDMCRWPNQLAGQPDGALPAGATTCTTEWADPFQFLPQANGDTLAEVEGTVMPVAAGAASDATLADAVVQLPPPGHPAALRYPPINPDEPGGTWWSPGNDDRANGADCPLGGPATTDWFTALLAWVLPWLFGC